MKKILTAAVIAASSLSATTAVFAPAASAAYCTSIPLPSGHFYGLNDYTVYSHSGQNATDRRKIANIQFVLKAKGINVAIDGSYGYGTRAAVVVYQKQNRLLADGRVGPATWASLANAAMSTPSPGIMCS